MKSCSPNNSRSNKKEKEGEITLVISYPELQSLEKIIEEMKQFIFFW